MVGTENPSSLKSNRRSSNSSPNMSRDRRFWADFRKMEQAGRLLGGAWKKGRQRLSTKQKYEWSLFRAHTDFCFVWSSREHKSSYWITASSYCHRRIKSIFRQSHHPLWWLLSGVLLGSFRVQHLCLPWASFVVKSTGIISLRSEYQHGRGDQGL